MRRRLLALACLSLMAVVFPASSARAALSAEKETEARVLIAKFTDRRFAVRQEAVEQLAQMGADVLPLVRKTLEETGDNEVKTRCRMVVDRLTAPPEPERLVERVIRKLDPRPPGRDAWRTPDGVYTSYIIKRDGRDIVVHLGKEQKPYDRVERTSSPPDGQHIACVVSQGGRKFVVRDGVEGPAFEGVGWFFWSDDGRHLAYFAVRGARKEQKQFIVLNGVEPPAYDGATRVWFSPDMEHAAWVAERDGKAFFVIDRVEGPRYDYICMGKPGRRGKLAGVIVDGREAWAVEMDWAPVAGALREQRLKSLGRVPDGFPEKNRIHAGEYGNAFVNHFRRDGRLWVIHNGREMGPYDGLWWSKASEDGEHYAFAATRAGKRFAVIDGKEGPAYDEVLNFCWSSNGRRLAYRAKRGEESFIVLDGREIPQWSRRRRTWTFYDMGFSPDGKHFYYADRDEAGYFIVCDGYRGRSYSDISREMFSPDSRHLYYQAERGGRTFLVCDGLEGPEHGKISQIHVSGATGRLTCFTDDAGDETLIEIAWPAGRDWMSGLGKLPD